MSGVREREWGIVVVVVCVREGDANGLRERDKG